MPITMPVSFGLFRRIKETLVSGQNDKVSTSEDRFEEQVCTSVESYFLFNVENDTLTKLDEPVGEWSDIISATTTP